MANSLTRMFPAGTKRITTGCQYCAVGCGYNAFLVPEGDSTEAERAEGVSRFITPAMTGNVRYKGDVHKAAVAPDARCDLNKGNHSVRGGSQGHNLVTANGTGRSTAARLKTPQVRLADGTLAPLTWTDLKEILARLIIDATKMKKVGAGEDANIEVVDPDALGVKLYEYQYLENTYSATKLFYGAVGTRNLAYHDRPSAADSSPGMADAGMRPHDFSYDDILAADLVFIIGTNPYENQSVFFMQYCQGKEIVVLDPRETATAQYALQTGGMHLKPHRLGADSFVLYAIARELITTYGFEAPDLEIGSPAELATDASKPNQRRRASRVLDFSGFESFLNGSDDEGNAYTLAQAAVVSGIAEDTLTDAVRRLAGQSAKRPKVAILYEKGLIWGFNYHNTAAVASLGLLLGSYGREGRLTGRVGGHQKGWAENDAAVHPFKGSTGGYPFGRSGTPGDHYSDRHLEKAFPNVPEDQVVQVKHNLDNHVFGPTEGLHSDQQGIANDEVRLLNGLVTKRDPDVKLLWIIGSNYFGQTNQAQTKRKRLAARRNVSPGPSTPAVNAVVEALTKRMDEDGIVTVHQELFENPTTSMCDLVIPAAGWGEDSFCRYNAQRRLKLYERFQDPPLHSDDQAAIGAGDPMRPERVNGFLHSPKPDWIIFRDVAKKIGGLLDAGDGRLKAAVDASFSWETSAALADEMAEKSHRSSILGDLLSFATAKGIGADNNRLHALLGAGGNGDAAGLAEPDYIVQNDLIDTDKSFRRDTTSISKVYGNAVASNGVMLPVRCENGQLVGTLRNVGRYEEGDKPLFYFVKAPWSDIKWAFERANEPLRNGIILTNGRFNHLWNNMFHHIRNDYVNERYPEDMPGTILEVNGEWAEQHDLVNGQVVEVSNAHGQFRAIVSRQDGVSEGTGFAMFSYPALQDGRLLFDGYVNNLTDPYADGINAIGALKFAHATVKKLPDPNDGGDWIFESRRRAGPTYEQRNRIGPIEPRSRPGEPSSPAARRDWEMRELIVRKGLPRALVHGGEGRSNSFADPNKLLRDIPLDVFKWLVKNNVMRWFDKEGRVLDEWHGHDSKLALSWNRSEAETDDGFEQPNNNNDRGEGTNVAVTPSFDKHIKQMFREVDIESMKNMFDLSDYQTVKQFSDQILLCLKGEGSRPVMPPVSAGGPWPKEWIDLFVRWIHEGHPR